jgi:hypothetical protein
MKQILTFIIILFGSAGLMAQVERTVIVEHFTNSRCGICAAKNPAFYNVLDDFPNVLHIAYHPSSPYSNCIFSAHNPSENDDRTNLYGIYGGTPRAVLQGNVVPVQSPLVSADDIESALGGNSDYMITLSQEQVNENMVDTRIVIKRVSGQGGQLRLYAVIAEKEVNYAAPNGEDLHHDVFRKVLVDESINLQNINDSIVFEESYNINSEWVGDELFVTAMVQDNSNKAILQAAASNTLEAGSNSVDEEKILSADGLLYPNPAFDYVQVSTANQIAFIQADFYAVTGNLVKSFNNPERLNISELPKGIYMVMLTDTQQNKYLGRIVKR